MNKKGGDKTPPFLKRNVMQREQLRRCKIRAQPLSTTYIDGAKKSEEQTDTTTATKVASMIQVKSKPTKNPITPRMTQNRAAK